jgi:hypothetical protein
MLADLKGCDQFSSTERLRMMMMMMMIKFGDSKGKTESTAVAIQDQTVSTNYFTNQILKEETDSKYCLCKQHVLTT